MSAQERHLRWRISYYLRLMGAAIRRKDGRRLERFADEWKETVADLCRLLHRPLPHGIDR